jgi:hypothetical protein
MYKINELEALIWRRATEAQRETGRRPGPDLAIRTTQTPCRDAAMPGAAGGAIDVAAVIPIRWMPVERWAKSVRAGKFLRS